MTKLLPSPEITFWTTQDENPDSRKLVEVKSSADIKCLEFSGHLPFIACSNREFTVIRVAIANVAMHAYLYDALEQEDTLLLSKGFAGRGETSVDYMFTEQIELVRHIRASIEDFLS